MPQRCPQYKPLLYTTTIRNPERYKDFMSLLLPYNGKTLTNELIKEIECNFFKVGLYRPVRQPESVRTKFCTTSRGEFTEYALTDAEVSEMYDMNDPLRHQEIKGHKEFGFDRGWPSRFDTQFKLMKTLGFVNYSIGNPIVFSETGKFLAQAVQISIGNDGQINRELVHPEYEQMAFLHALSKQQRCNPFIKELNDNIPLILLLQTIKLLNADPDYHNCGISYKEIPLIIFWKDNNAQALYERIKQLRNQYGYSPSAEIIEDICTREILGTFKRFKTYSIIREYPDDFIRKMRTTGLITFRGGGRFIDINHCEDAKIEYIINNYSNYEKYDSPDMYFDYMSRIDNNLLNTETVVYERDDASNLLNNWLETYGWDKIKKELTLLSARRSSSDEVLRFIDSPARLEFLTALAIKCKLPNVTVVPNYRCDDTGLPTSTASGGKGDIECFETPNGILVEVTMIEGRSQTREEIWPIDRHLGEFKDRFPTLFDSQCVFIAPSIYSDSINQIRWLRDQPEHHVIRPLKIVDFVSYLETATSLYA